MQLTPAERTATQIIRAAFPPGEEPGSVPALRADAWGAVAQGAWRHNLAPMLFAALKHLGRTDDPPAAVTEMLRLAYLRTSAANWLAFQELGDLLAQCARENISMILLKGAALANTVYPNIALRPMGDLDLLIRFADAPRLGEMLAVRGFAPSLEPTRNFYAEFSYDQAFVRGGKRPLMIETHWHLFSQPYYRNRIPIAWFWERTQPMTVNGHAAQMFAPTAQIVHLAAHAVLHHQGQGLLGAHDFALVLARQRAQINWDDALTAARAFGLNRVLLAALDQAREVWGVSAPDDVSAHLARAVGLRERILFAVNTSRHVEAREVWDALNLPRGKSKLGYLKPILFPSRAYMLERYGIADARALPMHYARRLGRGAQLFARSCAAMAGSVTRGLRVN